MLATGGGLVFTGKLTGEFVALDEDDRQDAVAIPDRLEHQRHGNHLHPQGPAIRDVASGRGGVLANRYAAEKVPAGGSVWTFALMP